MVLVDSDPHTARVLAAELGRRDFGTVAVVNGAAALPPLLANGAADVVIVNHRYEEAGALAACTIARRLAPGCATVVVSAPGPALHAVRAGARQSLSSLREQVSIRGFASPVDCVAFAPESA